MIPSSSSIPGNVNAKEIIDRLNRALNVMVYNLTDDAGTSQETVNIIVKEIITAWISRLVNALSPSST